jgi:alpha-tubulin suppressor-like RCC1 family protein
MTRINSAWVFTVFGASTLFLVMGCGGKLFGKSDGGGASDSDGTSSSTVSSTEVTAFAAHGQTCAVVGGGLKCWGDNTYGQLGNNSVTNSAVPVQVKGLTKGVTAVATGGDKTCAVVNGHVSCWGDNNGGLSWSDVSDVPREKQGSLVPVQVEGFTKEVTAIAGGERHMCALAGGSVMCWGSNDKGQCGVSGIDPIAPVQVEGLVTGVTSITAGNDHTCAVVNGGAKCWGNNDNNQLGIASTVEYTTYYDEEGDEYYDEEEYYAPESNIPLPVEGLTEGVTAIAAGYSFTCAVVNGGVMCWGINYNGQLGDGSMNNSPLPVQVEGLTAGVTAIAVGNSHACALVNGGVMCWGSNGSGKLGNGRKTDSSVPVQVKGLSKGVTLLAAGTSHTCAVVDGVMKCWGWNGVGTLGNGSEVDSLVPVKVAF